MRNLIRQFERETWPILTGPIVVSSPNDFVSKNIMVKIIRQFAGNRVGPLTFHRRDGPPNVTGPPRGTGPPEIFSSATGPPKTKGQLMEWLVEKKNLKRS